ncbi:MAG: hypothetical protein IPM94_00825 [bacterium]|nr:hypothetical protein [bacterium]
MFVEHEGRLMALGKFYTSAPRNARQRAEHTWRLAVWEEGWRVVSPPLEPKVEFLSQIVSVGGDVVVLGSFTGSDAVQEHGAAWDGQRWRELDLHGDYFGISCATVIDRRLYLAWRTLARGDTSQYVVAEWDGRRVQVIKPGVNSEVSAMTGRNGRLVVSFDILQQEIAETSMIQEWDGERWQALPGSFSRRFARDARIAQLAVYHGYLVATGDFNCIDERVCRNVAFLDGDVWRPLGSGVTGVAERLVPMASSLWLSGGFETAGGDLSQHVARWDGPLPVGSMVEPLTECAPEVMPVILRGDGWHSHNLDMTDPPLPFANGDFLALTDGLPDRWEWHANSDGTCPQDSIALLILPEGGVGLRTCCVPGAYPSLAQRVSVEGGRFYRVRVTQRLTSGS